MEVSTQQTSMGFGCYSDHQGVSYEEDSFDQQEYGKQFSLSIGYPNAQSHQTLQKYLGRLDDEDDVMSYDGSSSSVDDMTGMWETESIGTSDSDGKVPFEQGEDWEDDITESQLNENNKTGVTFLAASTEMLRIRFPFLSISVRLADFFCLQDRDLLNDTIVDFYLNHVVEHLLPDEPDKRVTVLPAIFWHNLSILQSALPDDYEAMNAKEQLDVRFADVLEFLEDFELFDVDYLVIPVNEWEHWSLAIVCHPFTDRGRTVCFDSQINDDPNDIQKTAGVIDEFLKYAWERRAGCGRLENSHECVIPLNLSQQTNNYDCGLFVLEYARRFLMNPPEKLDDLDFASCYSDFCVEGKRREIQKTILSLTANRNIWLPLLELIESRTPSFH